MRDAFEVRVRGSESARCDCSSTTSATPPAPARRFICRCLAPATCAATARSCAASPSSSAPSGPDMVGLIEVDTGSIRTGLAEPGRAHRRRARPLLHLPVQVRRGLDQPVHADRAQAGQRVPVGAQRARRALSLLRHRHQAPHHRAGAFGRLRVPRAPVAEVPPAPVPAALAPRPDRAGDANR